jgi:HEAT repeat protein
MRHRIRQLPLIRRTAIQAVRHMAADRGVNPCLILIVLLVLCGRASAQQPPEFRPMRAEPLYEQCAALTQAGEAPASAVAGLKEKDPQKRVKAARALAESCDARAGGPLVAALKDPDVAVRISAVEALGRLGDRNTIDSLIEALNDEDWRVRAALARSLCSFQAYAPGNATLNVLANPGDKKITEEGDLRARCQGILMVNQLRDVRFSRKAIGFLFLFLNSENEKLRGVAEETAMELKNTRNGYRELIGILKQNNFPDFRRKAAYYLGKFNIEEARPALTEASVGDRDPGVQKVAKEALEGMKKQ